MLTRIISSLVFNIARIISFLPFSWLYGLSKFVSLILHRILGYRRSVIIQNLSRSFPQLKYKEIKSIADAFYLHFTDVFIEVVKSISLPGTAFRKRYRVENPELLVEYYQNNRNIIGLTGHVANWEWLSIVPSLYPFSCYTLYKPLRNKIAENLMTRIRLRFGMKLLPMASAARYILSNKDNKALYIFIGDQSPHKTENDHHIEFLHQPTTFFNGGAKLAKATKAAIVYISIRKIKRGHYSLTFIPIETSEINRNIELSQASSGNLRSGNEFEDYVIKSYAALLEDDIIANPVHWLWSHKRWKH